MSSLVRAHDRDREAVVSLPAHGLECRRAETRRVGDQLEHAARALDTGKRVGGIADGASDMSTCFEGRNR